MNFNLNDEHLLIQNTARDFAQNELAPEVINRDINKIWPKEAVAKTRNLKSNRLGELLSKIPREESAVADPTLTNRPSIVQRGTTAANARALQGIEGYGRNLGDLTAETGAFNNTKQQLAGLESRFAISEKAREQRVLAALLANKLQGLQNTYSKEADIADKAGSLAAIYGGGI